MSRGTRADNCRKKWFLAFVQSSKAANLKRGIRVRKFDASHASFIAGRRAAAGKNISAFAALSLLATSCYKNSISRVHHEFSIHRFLFDNTSITDEKSISINYQFNGRVLYRVPNYLAAADIPGAISHSRENNGVVNSSKGLEPALEGKKSSLLSWYNVSDPLNAKLKFRV